MKNKILFPILAAAAIAYAGNAPCVVVIGSSHNSKSADADAYNVEDMDKDQIIATLKEDIQSIDEQMAQCKKAKKGWIAATVIGGAGILGTGISALVQNKQIQDKKSVLGSAQDQLKEMQ
jgi:hypothetical protein